MMAANRSYKKPERFRCPRCSEHRLTPEANLVVRHPRTEEPQKRRVTDETGKSGTDTHKDTETGHSGHENHECGRFERLLEGEEMSQRPIRTAMRELRMHEGAVKLLHYAAQDIEHNQCQDCQQYDVSNGAIRCPNLQPARTNSGAIECTRMKKGGR